MSKIYIWNNLFQTLWLNVFFQFLDAGAILMFRNDTSASVTVLRNQFQSQVKGCVSLWASSVTRRVTQVFSCSVLPLFPPFPVWRWVPDWPGTWEWWWGVPVIHSSIPCSYCEAINAICAVWLNEQFEMNHWAICSSSWHQAWQE